MALLALGSNLPWRGLAPSAVLQRAVDNLAREFDVRAVSGVWRTPSWPDATKPAYRNLCLRLSTDWNPRALLDRLLAIERAFDREREEPNAPRTLDLDIVDFGGQVVDLPPDGARPALTLPHPRMHERAFVLLPLIDVAPLWRHPTLGLSAVELLARLPEKARTSARRVTFADDALDKAASDGDASPACDGD